jgi:hypothetical protein
MSLIYTIISFELHFGSFFLKKGRSIAMSFKEEKKADEYKVVITK